MQDSLALKIYYEVRLKRYTEGITLWQAFSDLLLKSFKKLFLKFFVAAFFKIFS